MACFYWLIALRHCLITKCNNTVCVSLNNMHQNNSQLLKDFYCFSNKYIGFKVIPAKQKFKINKTLLGRTKKKKKIKLAHFMLNLKSNEQRTNCKHILSVLLFLPLPLRLTSKPSVKLLRCFIIFTCNEQKTSDKAWNAGNHYKSEINCRYTYSRRNIGHW